MTALRVADAGRRSTPTDGAGRPGRTGEDAPAQVEAARDLRLEIERRRAAGDVQRTSGALGPWQVGRERRAVQDLARTRASVQGCGPAAHVDAPRRQARGQVARTYGRPSSPAGRPRRRAGRVQSRPSCVSRRRQPAQRPQVPPSTSALAEPVPAARGEQVVVRHGRSPPPVPRFDRPHGAVPARRRPGSAAQARWSGRARTRRRRRPGATATLPQAGLERVRARPSTRDGDGLPSVSTACRGRAERRVSVRCRDGRSATRPNGSGRSGCGQPDRGDRCSGAPGTSSSDRPEAAAPRGRLLGRAARPGATGRRRQRDEDRCSARGRVRSVGRRLPAGAASRRRRCRTGAGRPSAGRW